MIINPYIFAAATYERTAFISPTGGDGVLNDINSPYGSIETAKNALWSAYPYEQITLRFLDSTSFGSEINITDMVQYLTIMSHGGTRFSVDTIFYISESNAPQTDIKLGNIEAVFAYENSTTTNVHYGGIYTGVGSYDSFVTITANGAGGGGGNNGADVDTTPYPLTANNGSDGNPPTSGDHGTSAGDAYGEDGTNGSSGGRGYHIHLAGNLSATVYATGGNGGGGGNGGSAGGHGGNGGNGGNATGTDQDGGIGGNGGNAASAIFGGDAGHGGNGGSGGNVYITAPAICVAAYLSGGSGGIGGVFGNAIAGSGGAGGNGGLGSGMGANGYAGNLGVSNDFPVIGNNGYNGSAGSDGIII